MKYPKVIATFNDKWWTIGVQTKEDEKKYITTSIYGGAIDSFKSDKDPVLMQVAELMHCEVIDILNGIQDYRMKKSNE